VLNLGGIANLTWLPAGGAAEGVIAFDVGPANSLTDAVIQLATAGAERFDRDGARARAGRVRSEWLAEMLDDAYLERPPPKSTGRERYGLAEAQAWWQRARGEANGLEDLLATLTRASTTAIAQAWRRMTEGEPGQDRGRLLVGGGGARNALVMETLAAMLPGVVVEPMDAAGVPAAAAEAMAFSLMGRNALRGEPNQLPQCTGVETPAVLGVVHGAEWWRGVRERPARA
jgi:anhydro-N-acetylmuramic acid kinase